MKKLNWCKTVCSVCVLCATTAIASPGQTFTTLYSFDGTHGAYPPEAALIQATDGNFYGTTSGGGAKGGGTIFKIHPSGTLTSLYSFCSQSGCADGKNPYAGMVQGSSDGNFYGTTYAGGANHGTIFRITPSGTLTTLHSFCSQSGCADGSFPFAAPVQGTDGNFYGTTWSGGANHNGTVFKITAGGVLTTLHSFSSTDGRGPAAGLVQGSDGNFYGTAGSGGANNNGTVFKITTTGVLTTLYSFCSQSSCTDGASPYAALVQAIDGDFYGTTSQGGTNDTGTVFKMTPSGTLTTLYSFCSQTGCTDGQKPLAALVQASDGNFYGTTETAEANSYGTVFEITPAGTLTTLHTFNNADGAYPNALVQDTNGSFYATTHQGGNSPGDGTVFSLSVGLGPFVETQPTSGKVGAVVKILGTNLTGATGVTFNGTAAVFKVKSSSEITATVPTGSTTGPVQVVTPSGTLTSNVSFRVLP